jgi:hypothetical protein
MVDLSRGRQQMKIVKTHANHASAQYSFKLNRYIFMPILVGESNNNDNHKQLITAVKTL